MPYIRDKMNRDKTAQVCCKRKERNGQYLEEKAELKVFLKMETSIFILLEKIQ